MPTTGPGTAYPAAVARVASRVRRGLPKRCALASTTATTTHTTTVMTTSCRLCHR